MRKAELHLAITCHKNPPADWNDFVMECEPSHFEQTSWWANVESGDGWIPRYVVARDMDRIAAGAMVLVRRQSGIGRAGYVFRGPLTCREFSDSEHIRGSLAVALKDFAREEHLVVLVIVPAYDGTKLANTFFNRGFLRHPSSLPPTSLPRGKTSIDLRREPKVIEQGYRRTLQKQINRARKQGVTVKLGDSGDLEMFWKMHLELCRRRGVASNVPGFDYVRRVWYEFQQHARAWMFNAVLGEDVLCSLICLGAGKWFYTWRIGWAPDSEKAYPTQAAFAEAINTAVKVGYQFFDFLGIDPDEVAIIERGGGLNTPTSGITFFKMGFGGDISILPPTLDWFPNPAVRLFMRCAGLRLFSSRGFKMFARLLTRAEPTNAETRGAGG